MEWENTNAVNESGGSATIGDASGDEAILYNTPKAAYDILDNSGIGQGSFDGLVYRERRPVREDGRDGREHDRARRNQYGTIEVTSGTLDFEGGISGTGADTISGACHAGVGRRSLGRPNSFTSQAAAANSHCTNRGSSPVTSAASTRPEPDRTTRSRSPSTGSLPASPRTPGGTQGALGFTNGASHPQPHAHRRLQPRRLRASNPGERKHADNLQLESGSHVRLA